MTPRNAIPIPITAILALAAPTGRADSRVDAIPFDTETGSLSAAEVDTESWSSAPAGFSFARAYRSGADDYLVLLRQHTGELEIRNLGAGSIDSVSASYHLNHRFTGMDVMRVGATPYLFLHDAGTGHLRTYELDSDGTLGASTETSSTTLAGRELFKTVVIGGQGRTFAYDRWTGGWVVYSTAGALIASGTWTRGWTAVDFITIGPSTYRMLYKASDEPGSQGGRLQIARIDANFATLATVHDAYHAENWSEVRFLPMSGIGGENLVAFYNAATGDYATRSFNGALGGVVQEETIDTGWTDMTSISIGASAYALMLSETGVAPLGANQIENFAQSVRAALTTPCASGTCVAGYQLALLENGRIVHKEAGGVRNADTGIAVTDGTTFTLGSVSKVIASTTLLRRIDWGEVDLNAPIVNYLDYDDTYDFDDFHAHARFITVRDALAHTVGIPDSPGDCTVADETSGFDCTPLLTKARTANQCGPNPAIADSAAITCGRFYANENTGLVRNALEYDATAIGMESIVDLTYALWLGDTNVVGRTCAATPATDSDTHHGLSLTVTASADNISCAPGGWKLSAIDVGELAHALRYEKVLGPELTLVLLTNSAGFDMVWDQFTNVATISSLAYKNGATTGVETQFGMETAGTNRQVDVVLLTNTTAPPAGNGINARVTLNNGFAAMGNP